MSKQIDQVNFAIAAGCTGRSALDSAILDIKGLSSARVRHFLNVLCRNPAQRYLEIGVFHGSTFISANYKNPHNTPSVAIDSWVDKTWGTNNEETFLQNANRFLSPEQFVLINEDCFKVETARFTTPFDIYFFDGAHTEEAQYKALEYYDSVLAKDLIFVVDDWNMPEAKTGTRNAIKDLGWQIEREWELESLRDGDRLRWWNGLFVAVMHKG